MFSRGNRPKHPSIAKLKNLGYLDKTCTVNETDQMSTKVWT